MPRIPRISIPGVPMHVVQRGNNRQAVFFHERDYTTYLNTLFESAMHYNVSVHAFVCMTNHVHLLVTPWDEHMVSRMIQRLGASYTAAINSTYSRTGSLWEGRFKSSLVDSNRYVLACYRYIELNPVRAGIVRRPADYRWSSYRHNTRSASEYPISAHPEWLAMGASPSSRRRRYAQLVYQRLHDDQIERIRYGTRKGLPTGSSRFRKEIETMLNRRLGEGRRGRPKKGL